MGSLANLEDLYLSGNQLWWGCIPTSLQNQSVSVSGSPFCASVPETDREALVALYNATDGPNWANEHYWLSGASIREWYGVTTDDNGRVTWLWLYGNQLSGEIPPELGSLANLYMLNLSENQLSGEVPSELGQLSNLESLVLSYNRLKCLSRNGRRNGPGGAGRPALLRSRSRLHNHSNVHSDLLRNGSGSAGSGQ